MSSFSVWWEALLRFTLLPKASHLYNVLRANPVMQVDVVNTVDVVGSVGLG